MSGNAAGAADTTKAVVSDTKDDSPTMKDQAQKPSAASLEEDDEFEDFPAEDWQQEDTELPGGNAHLWEESWDDDDTNEDFAAQLREELKKAESANKRG